MATNSQTGIYRIGEWLFHAELRQLERDGRIVRLEPRVGDLLRYLVESPDPVASREKIMQAVWPGVVVGDEAINNAINKLRRAFDDDRQHPEYIETLPKSGYRLIADVGPGDAAGQRAAQAAADGTSSAVEMPVADKQTGPGRAWLAVLGVLGAVVAAALVLIPLQLGTPPQPPPVDNASEATPTPDLAAAIPAQPSIAVLPFENVSDDPDQEYFADGMTDDLITDLSKVRGLTVISRTSSFAYKGKPDDVREIAGALGARFIVEGSVRRADGKIRVNAQLVDADTGLHVWAERYDNSVDEVFALQDRITSQIVTALGNSIGSLEPGRIIAQAQVDLDAYDLYLRGSGTFQRFSRDDTFLARRYFEQAIEVDPDFAAAYAMLAWTHVFEYTNGWAEDPQQTLQQALAIAERSIALDGGSPVAHFVKGLVYRETRAFDQALAEARRVIEIEPSYANGYVLMATLLYYSGQPQQGLDMLEAASRLNPLHPSNYPFHKGQALFILERYDEAIAAFKAGLAQNPTSQRLRVWLAATYAQQGRISEATWEAGEILNEDPKFSPANLDSIFPFQSSADLRRFNDALRRAGFADLPAE